MKKITYFLFLLLIGNIGYAQVGIGTDAPNPSTQLEIVAQDRGVLIPQVPLTSTTDQTTIQSGNIESLLVYNTQAIADITPGYYYWYQGSWKRILSSDDANGQETLTFLEYDDINNTLVYSDENGNDNIIDLQTVFDDLQTTSTLVDNGDGTYTYTDELGIATTINPGNSTSTLIDNADGSFTYTDEQGNTTIIDVSGVVLTELQDNTSDIYNEIQNVVAANSDSFVDHGDGTFTHTAADGTAVTFDANTATLTDNGDGSYTLTNADGTTVTVDAVGDVLTELQDNTSDIYNEIENIINTNSDALMDNGNGTFTHTAADGTVTTFDANTATLSDNGDGTYDLTNADGTTITVDTNADTSGYDNTASGLTATNVQDALDEIATTAGIVSPLVDNGNGTFTYTDETGLATTFDANTTTLSDNGDGTYDLTNADGTTITVDVVGDVLNELQDNTSDIYSEVVGMINSNDTNTTNVSLTEDGTNLILTDSDGNTVQVPLADLADDIDTDTNTTNVSLTEDGTNLILTDSDGNTVQIALADLADDIDTNTTNVSLTEDGTNLILTDSDGNTVQVPLADLADDIDTNTTNVSLSQDGTDFILTDSDGNTVTMPLSELAGTDADTNTTNVSLTEDGTNLILEDSDGNTVQVPLADLADDIDTDTNTTNVSLTEDGTNLILTDSDGNTVQVPLADLADDIDTNTTNVSLTEDGTNLILEDSDGNTVQVPLADLADDIDTDTNTTNVSLTEDGTNLILTDSDGNDVQIPLADIDTNTTNTGLTQDGTDLIITDSDGNTTTMALSELAGTDADTNTTNVSLTEDGTNLILEDSDGNTVQVPLADLADDIDTDTNTTNVSLSQDGTDFILTDSDGNTVTMPLSELAGTDADTNTTNVSLTEDGTNLILTDSDGNDVQIPLADLADDIDTNTTNVSLTEDGTNLILTDSDGNDVQIPLADLADNIDTNTTNVSLTEDGTNLILTDSDGNTVQIPLADIDTDDQTASEVSFTSTAPMTSTNVQDAIDELAANANTSTVTQVVTTGNTIATHDDDTGNTTDILETVTTLGIAAGELTYANEDGTNANVPIISTDVDNALVAGTDGALFVSETVADNIYNTDGALTDNREVDLNNNNITFQGFEGFTSINAGGASTVIESQSADRAQLRFFTQDEDSDGVVSNFDIDLFSDNYLQMFASGEMNGISFGTHVTQNPSPIEFITSNGGLALGETRMRIEGNGNISFTEYPNTRDDSGTTSVENLLYTDDSGNLLSAPAANVVAEPWFNQADGTQATANNQDIYQMGKVGIGTDEMLLTANPDVQLAVNGSILTTTSIYADYVFEDYFEGVSELNKEYSFKSLKEIGRFIDENRHLPGITKIDALAKNEKGDYVINASELSIQVLEKVEELYLHTIEQEKALNAKDKEIEALKEKQNEMEQRLERMEKLLLEQQD